MPHLNFISSKHPDSVAE